MGGHLAGCGSLTAGADPGASRPVVSLAPATAQTTAQGTGRIGSAVQYTQKWRGCHRHSLTNHRQSGLSASATAAGSAASHATAGHTRQPARQQAAPHGRRPLPRPAQPVGGRIREIMVFNPLLQRDAHRKWARNPDPRRWFPPRLRDRPSVSAATCCSVRGRTCDR